MCGIAGIRRFGAEPITAGQICTLLLECQSRGIGASGIALQRKDGEIFIAKAAMPAWAFVSDDICKEFLKKYLDDNILVAMVHARAPTVGDPKHNENNHPLMKANGDVCAIHNGHIWNHDLLFDNMKLKRNAEVDSDIIRAILEEHGLTPAGIRQLKRMNGSAAIAALSQKQPGKLLLARSGSPIVLASTEETLVWASEKRFIHTAMRPFTRRFGILQQVNRSDMSFTTMNDDSAWILGDLQDDPKHEGERTAVEFHEEFDTCTNYTPPRYAPHETFSNYRSRWWANKLPEATVCGNKECGIALTIPESQRTKNLWELVCGKCKHPLGTRPAAA